MPGMNIQCTIEPKVAAKLRGGREELYTDVL